jgi:hypothetical protein
MGAASRVPPRASVRLPTPTSEGEPQPKPVLFASARQKSGSGWSSAAKEPPRFDDDSDGDDGPGGPAGKGEEDRGGPSRATRWSDVSSASAHSRRTLSVSMRSVGDGETTARRRSSVTLAPSRPGSPPALHAQLPQHDEEPRRVHVMVAGALSDSDSPTKSPKRIVRASTPRLRRAGTPRGKPRGSVVFKMPSDSDGDGDAGDALAMDSDPAIVGIGAGLTGTNATSSCTDVDPPPRHRRDSTPAIATPPAPQRSSTSSHGARGTPVGVVVPASRPSSALGAGGGGGVAAPQAPSSQQQQQQQGRLPPLPAVSAPGVTFLTTDNIGSIASLPPSAAPASTLSAFGLSGPHVRQLENEVRCVLQCACVRVPECVLCACVCVGACVCWSVSCAYVLECVCKLCAWVCMGVHVVCMGVHVCVRVGACVCVGA